jgi:O-antigen/teichoic acid export membrane protein
LREILQFSLATLGGKIGWVLYRSADTIVLGKIAGDFALGHYAFAKDLALLPATKLSVLVNQLSVPVMAELQSDRTALRNSLLQFLHVIGCIVLPMCVGLVLVAEDFVLSILTEKWAPIVPLLQLLAVCALTQSVEMIFRTVLLARYRAGFLLRYTLVLLVIMPAAFWVGAVLSGSTGVAAAWALAYPIVMVGVAREVFKEIELSWRMLWGETRVAVTATIVMAGVVIALQGILNGTQAVASLTRFSLACLSGAFSYGMVIYLLGDPIVRDLRDALGWTFRPSKTAALKN